MVEAFPGGRRRSLRRLDGDPLALLVGMFDCSLVLALAIAVQARTEQDAGGNQVEVPAARRDLPRYRPATGQASGDGARLGIAYRLVTGEVVFVPETEAGAKQPRPR